MQCPTYSAFMAGLWVLLNMLRLNSFCTVQPLSKWIWEAKRGIFREVKEKVVGKTTTKLSELEWGRCVQNEPYGLGIYSPVAQHQLSKCQVISSVGSIQKNNKKRKKADELPCWESCSWLSVEGFSFYMELISLLATWFTLVSRKEHLLFLEIAKLSLCRDFFSYLTNFEISPVA